MVCMVLKRKPEPQIRPQQDQRQWSHYGLLKSKTTSLSASCASCSAVVHMAQFGAAHSAHPDVYTPASVLIPNH